MLKKMRLKNFLSFSKETVFDFTSTKYTILQEKNVADNGVLKGADFIGPNASGKSNALKGIGFLIELIKSEDIQVERYLCNFPKSRILSVSYEFLIDDNNIEYRIDYNGRKRGFSEKLEVNGKQILIRDGDEGDLMYNETMIHEKNLDEGTLFLRTASFNTGRFAQNDVLNKFMNFLMNSYYDDGYYRNVRTGKSLIKYAEENGVEKLNRYLDDFDYNFRLEYGSESQGEGLRIKLATGQKGIFFKRNSYPIPVYFYNESLGNQVLSSLLPSLIQTIEHPGMLILDEFGNSLHNVLAELIVKYFMKNATNSQLFFVSHDTNLMSNSILRPDQIFIVTFDGKDGSVFNRVSNYKPREAQNIEKMYLGGMFEGLPEYDEKV